MRFARYAWSVLAYNVLVILWGALVRATGSGAGCGNHWPLCNGELTPAFASWKMAIEFTHRGMTGLDTLAVAVLVIWAFRATPRGSLARRGAVLSAIFLVSEGLFGAALVLLQHVANDASPSRIYWLSAHFANTLTLVACLALTAWWAEGHEPPRLHGRVFWAGLAALVSLVAVGITGDISALGDTLFPSASLAAGLARDFDPASNLIVRLRGLHPALAACVGASVMIYAFSRGAAERNVRKLGYGVALAVVAQIGAGVLNLVLLAPVWMQIVHLLLAEVVWIALVLLAVSPSDANSWDRLPTGARVANSR